MSMLDSSVGLGAPLTSVPWYVPQPKPADRKMDRVL